MGYTFEWDAGKAESNLRKHGVEFAEATSVFADPWLCYFPTPTIRRRRRGSFSWELPFGEDFWLSRSRKDRRERA